jgi:glycosyltransferase involved in cell wall biosynthesis
MAPRDLFISAFAPTLGSGRATRTYTLIRALAALGPVDLAYVPFDGDEPAALYHAIEGLEFHRIDPSRGARRAVTYASRRATGHQASVARGASPEIVEATRRLAAVPGRGRVIAGDMHVMCAVVHLASRLPVIFNTHNIESAPEHDPNAGKPTWLPMRVTERRMLRRAQESWIVSREDLQLARRLAPGAALRLAPNVVDVAAIPACTAVQPGRIVLMVADFTYTRNREALQLLVDRILPLVWDELPDTRLRLVGRGLEVDRPVDHRIDVLGFVDSLDAPYADAGAVAVPLTAGGGTSLKFVEAMAYGVPVVSTPTGARGLGVTPGEHYREAREPEAFAAELVDLLRTGDRPMAARARAVAEREFSVDALTRLLDPAVPPAVS